MLEKDLELWAYRKKNRSLFRRPFNGIKVEKMSHFVEAVRGNKHRKIQNRMNFFYVFELLQTK